MFLERKGVKKEKYKKNPQEEWSPKQPVYLASSNDRENVII